MLHADFAMEWKTHARRHKYFAHVQIIARESLLGNAIPSGVLSWHHAVRCSIWMMQLGISMITCQQFAKSLVEVQYFVKILYNPFFGGKKKKNRKDNI
jgi:hypothetical protein